MHSFARTCGLNTLVPVVLKGSAEPDPQRVYGTSPGVHGQRVWRPFARS